MKKKVKNLKLKNTSTIKGGQQKNPSPQPTALDNPNDPIYNPKYASPYTISNTTTIVSGTTKDDLQTGDQGGTTGGQC